MDSATGINERGGYEVADIFRLYGEEYRANNGMTKKQHEVMTAVANCRSSWYGYHEDICNKCGHVERDFNSCRDRHCPKCQGISRRKWVNARLSAILPVPYYHVVFTLPHLLHSLIQYNKKLIYDLLYSSAAETLLTFGRDPKWLGGEIGFYGVLHTWGQTMWQHLHVHFIVPGGALTKDGRWVEPRYRSKFLFPVHALSKVFRGKFIEGLKTAYSQGDLSCPVQGEYLANGKEFERWLDRLVSRNWVVYCKPPFGDAAEVVRYIGRYTHRVAISNSRIIDIQDGQVQFKYKDYTENRIAWKTMQLNAQEFIRRFLWHVLPAGFHKVRHYGFLANGRCKSSISLIKNLLQCTAGKNIGVDDWRMDCPQCGIGKLFPHMIITRFHLVVTSVATLFKGVHGKYAYDTS